MTEALLGEIVRSPRFRGIQREDGGRFLVRWVGAGGAQQKREGKLDAVVVEAVAAMRTADEFEARWSELRSGGDK